MIGVEKNKVKVLPYDDIWKIEYKREELVLKQYLKGFKIRIEHIGSTSIIGLSAKPIIDIAVGVVRQDELPVIANKLAKKGYDILDTLESNEEILARKGEADCYTHYIHLTLVDSKYWNEFMYFKRYLLDHPDTLEEYRKLKETLYERYSTEKSKYTLEKRSFINKVLKKAYKLYNVQS